MDVAYQSPAYRGRPSSSERIAASALSLSIIGAIILALLWVTAAPLLDLGRDNPLATFDVASGERAPTAERRDVPRPKAAERATPPPPAERAPPPPPAPVPVPTVPGMIILSREDYARSDIGAMERPADGDGRADEVADAGGGGRPVYGPSEMPGGRVLHAADWYREPTRAEMAPFMPPRQQVGWGVIACQTAERFRVENCRELGESPGSGIARGLRRASWQFLVRPPTVNGKPTIGAWVRIRFDLVEGIVK